LEKPVVPDSVGGGQGNAAMWQRPPTP
jgi:hypothetical protein